MPYDFALVDVFSDQPFGGNQLAVFPDARGVREADMQALAREFNFSETTFVLPPEDPRCTHKVRIFTPQAELPFAGHPTIGTAAVIAARSGGKEFVFEEAIGPVGVTVDGDALAMHVPSPVYDTTDTAAPVGEVAKALSLSADAVADAWYGGVGLRFCFVQVADNATVDAAVLDHGAWQAGLADTWAPQLYVFAGDTAAGGSVYARFFVPAFGITEDPATGSACASLVTGLALRSQEPEVEYRIDIRQGVAMGRPSALTGIARKRGGQVVESVVIGSATLIGTGAISLPGR